MENANMKTILLCRFQSTIVVINSVLIAVIIALLVLDMNNLIDIMSNHLNSRELENIDARTDIFVNSSSELFGKIINDVKSFDEYAQQVFQNQLKTENFYPVYDGTTSHPVNPSDYNDNQVYYSKFGSTVYQNNASVALDYASPLLKSSQSYQAVYFGFKDSYFHNFPFSDLSNFPTSSFQCVSTGQTIVGYDPTCRQWYDDAKDTTEIVFSVPYVDASSGQIIITASKAFRVDGEFLGVIGFDISMASSGFEEFVNDGTILESGYTYIYDLNGNLVFSPFLPDRNTLYSVTEIEFDDNGEKTEFQSILNLMKSLETGNANYTKDGEDWYIRYSPLPNTVYGTAKTASYSEIEKPADEFAQGILVGEIVGPIIFVLYLVGLLTYFAYMIRFMAGQISKMMNRFTNYMKSIAEQKLDVELGNTDEFSKDMRELARNFQNLVYVLRFANNDYYKNKFQEAYNAYLKIQGLFKEIGNDHGVGLAQNNLGHAASQLEQMPDHMKKAKQYFEDAIENAKEHVREHHEKMKLPPPDFDRKPGEESSVMFITEEKTPDFPVDDMEPLVSGGGKGKKNTNEKKRKKMEEESKKNESLRQFYYVTLANRLSGLGMFYYDMGQYENAIMFSKESIKYHKMCENLLGEMKVCGNIGLIYLSWNQPEKAEELFIRTYNTISTLCDNNSSMKNEEALQYASVNLGEFYVGASKFQEAQKFFNYALTLVENIKLNIRNRCLIGLLTVFESPAFINLPDAQDQVTRIKRDFQLFNRSRQSIVFVVDVSISMGNNDRIGKMKAGLQLIINEFLSENDLVTLIEFHNEYEVVFEDYTKKENGAEMMECINRMRTKGNTKFFDAVGYAVDKIQKNDMANSDQWIIALTDGEDNRSSKYYDYSRGLNQSFLNRIQKNDIGLIVLEVEMETNTMQIEILTRDDRTPETGKRRYYIPVNNARDIEHVFKTVAGTIVKGHRNIESTC